jgi:hypothetical protein
LSEDEYGYIPLAADDYAENLYDLIPSADEDDAEDEYDGIPLAEDDDAEDVAQKPQRCQWESRHAGHPEGEGLQYSDQSDHGWPARSLNGLNRC